MRTTFLLLLAGCLASPLLVQSVHAQSVNARTILYEGASQYSADELAKMSGLAPGTLTQAQVDAAMSRLDATGLFSSISYKSAGTTLHVVLEPMATAKARSVAFINFVLDTPDELNRKLHDRLPLYTGSVPVTGSMQTDVERALEAIEAEHGVHASVTSIGAPGSLNYSIASPPVVVGTVVLTGATFTGTPQLALIRDRFAGQEFRQDTSGEALRANLTDAFLDLGYVDIQLAPVTHSTPVVTPASITVDLQEQANPGALYKVARLDLPAPVPGVGAGDLARQPQLTVGGPASRYLALSSKAHLMAAFERGGYFDIAVDIVPHKDAAAHTVSYTFPAQPGLRYNTGQLRTRGLPPDKAATVEHAWKVAPGTPFDGRNVDALLTDIRAQSFCAGRSVDVETLPNRATHVADVVVSCPTR